MALVEVQTSYLSEKDIVYRPCTPEEFREHTANCMTIFAEAVRKAAEEAAAAEK